MKMRSIKTIIEHDTFIKIASLLTWKKMRPVVMETVVDNQSCVLDLAMRITIRITDEFTCAASALNTDL